ncbi:hypothetical protein DENSPDRAFT_842383 [Dentipellis sp. KUC8613]|nr:hypothetical protein DENSPDRAFT_842383 [Dentipellis sp. KUC8613]
MMHEVPTLQQACAPGANLALPNPDRLDPTQTRFQSVTTDDEGLDPGPEESDIHRTEGSQDDSGEGVGEGERTSSKPGGRHPPEQCIQRVARFHARVSLRNAEARLRREVMWEFWESVRRLV